VAGCLAKPVMESDLLGAVLSALDTAVAERLDTGPPTGTQLEGEQTPLHILLAEDNEVTREVVMRMLRKHGHTVATASNGEEAIEALDRESFDMVLMDIQMPVTDGLVATAKIRESERQTGRHIPIVGLTAGAVEWDRERCHAAGMDGYVSKPLKAQGLHEALQNVLSHAEKQAEGDADRRRQPEANLLRAAALSRMDGDEGLLDEIVSLFQKQAPLLLTELRESIAVRDPSRIEQAAHKLKGSVGVFDSNGAVEAAQTLESMGRSGDLSSSEAAYRVLADRVQQLAAALDAR
jgi:CheY-like chemotaxis protein